MSVCVGIAKTLKNENSNRHNSAVKPLIKLETVRERSGCAYNYV